MRGEWRRARGKAVHAESGKPDIVTVPSGKREGKATSGAERKVKGVSGQEGRAIGITDTYGWSQNGNRRDASYPCFVCKYLVPGAK